ncbi:MAG: hypothetical protein IPJ94_27700, partial [Chloroflexi bacterium]|nr:hypothetical protein [Chloroflexota bacterium]
RPFCPQFIKFSQVVGWKRPFCPQFIKFSQVVGWERPFTDEPQPAKTKITTR